MAQSVPVAPWHPVPVRLALAAIRFYQHHISPRKGWCCAHRTCHGGHSCSEWTKRAIAKRGLHTGMHLARRRFARCHTAATALRAQKEPRWETEEEKRARESKGSVWTRPHACICDRPVQAVFGACPNDITGWECLSCGCDILQLLAFFPW